MCGARPPGASNVLETRARAADLCCVLRAASCGGINTAAGQQAGQFEFGRRTEQTCSVSIQWIVLRSAILDGSWIVAVTVATTVAATVCCYLLLLCSLFAEDCSSSSGRLCSCYFFRFDNTRSSKVCAVFYFGFYFSCPFIRILPLWLYCQILSIVKVF